MARLTVPREMAPADWIEFWDSKHPIYVSPRHAAAHFHRIAEDIRGYAPAGGVMLDYGCGEALSAGLVAERTGRLILCEPAPQVRGRVVARFANTGNIAVRTPDEIAAMPEQSLDAIVLHSVSQYLNTAELDALLALFHRLLKPNALLIVGDIIPRDLGAFGDAWALLTFAAKEGFAVAAVVGLLRTYFSDYWQLRNTLGLTRYSGGEMVAKLNARQFSAERARTNIGHNAKRMTFLAHAR